MSNQCWKTNSRVCCGFDTGACLTLTTRVKLTVRVRILLADRNARPGRSSPCTTILRKPHIPAMASRWRGGDRRALRRAGQRHAGANESPVSTTLPVEICNREESSAWLVHPSRPTLLLQRLPPVSTTSIRVRRCLYYPCSHETDFIRGIPKSTSCPRS